MPYELSLEANLDRGGSIYRAVVEGELEPAAVRRLSDWVADARQNPDASFVIDLSASRRSSRRAQIEMRALLRRHADLRDSRRLSVVESAQRSKARKALLPAAAL